MPRTTHSASVTPRGMRAATGPGVGLALDKAECQFRGASVPTYQYACTECGHSFDIVQSFSEDSLSVCPECGGRLRKVYNAVGVVFKGSGFYRTDSREKKPSGASSSDGAAKSTAGESASTGSGSSSSSDGASTKSAPASTSKKTTESTKS